MSLRDTFRSIRKGGADNPQEDAARSDVPDPEVFAPRSDGVYDGGTDPDGKGTGLYLRFSGNRVRESLGQASAQAARDALGSAKLVGDYTSTGRFSVQAPFERPIVYTVLASDEIGFTARRTNSGTASTREITYAFVPDAASP